LKNNIEVSVNGYNVGQIKIFVRSNGVLLVNSMEQIVVPLNHMDELMTQIKFAMDEYNEAVQCLDGGLQNGKLEDT